MEATKIFLNQPRRQEKSKKFLDEKAKKYEKIGNKIKGYLILMPIIGFVFSAILRSPYIFAASFIGFFVAVFSSVMLLPLAQYVIFRIKYGKKAVNSYVEIDRNPRHMQESRNYSFDIAHNPKYFYLQGNIYHKK